MFKDLEIVKLVRDHESGAKAGYIGTIVDVLTKGAYMVEFAEMKGLDAIVAPLYDKDLVIATKEDLQSLDKKIEIYSALNI